MSISPSAHQEDTPAALREVKYEYSREFVPLLSQLNVTLLVSTYQAGKLVCIGSDPSGLKLSFHNFEQAMGVAVSPRQIAIGGRNLTIWFLAERP